MTPYTVVISDYSQHDVGFRGTTSYWRLASYFGAYAELGLYWFLCEYFGRSAVRLLRPSELLHSSEKFTTDWLFIGLPTTLQKQHLEKIEFRRMALYDSADSNGIRFGDSDQALLFSHTNLCLKCWRDRRWNFDFSLGLLPIKRPPLNNKLRIAIRIAAIKSGLGFRPKKKYDVGFVARPTGNLQKNPRIRWLIDLKRQRPDLKCWGGLVGRDDWRQFVENADDLQTLESCWLNRRKISFWQYFAGLCESKVALAPAGFAPWTYRHFEAIYARSIVVANDLSHYDFLIPFPRDGMIEVGDGESVVNGTDRALALYDRSPEIVDANIAQLDKWLDSGAYSKRCPDTIERFMSQLEQV